MPFLFSNILGPNFTRLAPRIRRAVSVAAMFAAVCLPLPDAAAGFQTAEQCQQSADALLQSCHALHDRFQSCRGTTDAVIRCRAQISDPNVCSRELEALRSQCNNMRMVEREQRQNEQRAIELDAEQRAELAAMQRLRKSETRPFTLPMNRGVRNIQNGVPGAESSRNSVGDTVNNVKRMFDLVVRGVDTSPVPDDAPVTNHIFEKTEPLKHQLQDKAMLGESGETAGVIQDRALILLKQQMREVERQAYSTGTLADEVIGQTSPRSTLPRLPSANSPNPWQGNTNRELRTASNAVQTSADNPWHDESVTTRGEVLGTNPVAEPPGRSEQRDTETSANKGEQAPHTSKLSCRELQRVFRHRWREQGKTCFSPTGVRAMPVTCCDK